jgi:hypothetical protein
MPDLQAQITEAVRVQGDQANQALLDAVTTAAGRTDGMLSATGPLRGLISPVSIQGAAGTMAIENAKEKIMNVVTVATGINASIKNLVGTVRNGSRQ